MPLAEVTKEQRNQAKTINFGIIYGVTAHGLQRRIDGLSYQAADQLIKSYHARFPSIAQVHAGLRGEGEDGRLRRDADGPKKAAAGHQQRRD